MNKKFLVFGILGLFAIGIISALAYYGVFTTTFTVLPALNIDGDLGQSLDDGYAGETITGEEIIVSNNAPSEREIVISDDSDENVSVFYTGVLELTKKIVNFSADVWEPTDGKVKAYYTIVGNEFRAVVNESIEGYSLIYYKDNSERFDNPAEAILVGYVENNLPYGDDANKEEYNYCDTKEYDTCYGAKLWYVPTNAINEDRSLDWSRASEFYFETELIQYNKEGNIVLYSGVDLKIIPQYDINEYASGTFTITTTIA